jgi:hypothetical protein
MDMPFILTLESYKMQQIDTTVEARNRQIHQPIKQLLQRDGVTCGRFSFHHITTTKSEE